MSTQSKFNALDLLARIRTANASANASSSSESKSGHLLGDNSESPPSSNSKRNNRPGASPASVSGSGYLASSNFPSPVMAEVKSFGLEHHSDRNEVQKINMNSPVFSAARDSAAHGSYTPMMGNYDSHQQHYDSQQQNIRSVPNTIRYAESQNSNQNSDSLDSFQNKNQKSDQKFSVQYFSGSPPAIGKNVLSELCQKDSITNVIPTSEFSSRNYRNRYEFQDENSRNDAVFSKSLLEYDPNDNIQMKNIPSKINNQNNLLNNSFNYSGRDSNNSSGSMSNSAARRIEIVNENSMQFSPILSEKRNHALYNKSNKYIDAKRNINENSDFDSSNTQIMTVYKNLPFTDDVYAELQKLKTENLELTQRNKMLLIEKRKSEISAAECKTKNEDIIANLRCKY